MTVSNQVYSAGHFELQIDGHQSQTFVRSVDGGAIKGKVRAEQTGSDNQQIKHLTGPQIEPVSLEIGLSGANDVLRWIQQTWNRKHSRHDGQITHADFNKSARFAYEFYRALIVETTFPALDGGSKEPAFLKVKIQPEEAKNIPNPGATRLKNDASAKQKLWSPSAFRLTVDGIPGLDHVNKIEPLTIKQGVKPFHTGADRFPKYEPTKIEFPSISGTIGMGYADALFAWHDRYVRSGESDPKAQTTGSLEFLSSNKRDTLFAIKLFEVGLSSLAVESSQANSDQIKRVKFELFVGRMDLDFSGLGFA